MMVSSSEKLCGIQEIQNLIQPVSLIDEIAWLAFTGVE
jgi:hypothetical protein